MEVGGLARDAQGGSFGGAVTGGGQPSGAGRRSPSGRGRSGGVAGQRAGSSRSRGGARRHAGGRGDEGRGTLTPGGRRQPAQFFTRALGITFGAFLGLNGISYLAFLWPRLSGGFGSDIDVGAVADLQAEVVLNDGSVLPKFVPAARAYIVPFAESDMSRSQFEGMPVVVGGLSVLFQRCVHLGCRVPWCETSQGFECPCHGSKYNYAGEYQAGPAPRNLDRFEVFEENGRLIVKTGTIFQTARAIAKTVQYPQGPSCIALTTTDEEA